MWDRLKYYLIKRQQKAKRGNTTRVIVAVFLLIIAIGAILLALPAASRSGRSCGLLTAFFTSTSATCVTGLVMGDTYSMWSTFGQVVIICLIQVGGLGFITIMSMASLIIKRKINLRERMIIAQSYNVSGFEGLVRLVRLVVTVAFSAELLGAALLSIRFVPVFGLWPGIGRGLFTAISAFCNAGFDLMGSLQPGSSLMAFNNDPLVLLTVSALVILGGLGFFVWEDIYATRSLKGLKLHSKLVLSISAALLVLGTVYFFLFEGAVTEMSLGKRLLNSFFQAVTLRTAGFDSINQGSMSDSSKAASILFMLVGGSPGSTAGGVKTVSVGIILLSCIATLRGKRYITAFGRTVTWQQVSSATVILLVVTMLAVVGGMFISAREGIPIIDAMYETVSALGTVGLTTGVTPSLSPISKILIAIYMFFGRVGVMTIGLAFMYGSRDEEKIKYSDGLVFIG